MEPGSFQWPYSSQPATIGQFSRHFAVVTDEPLPHGHPNPWPQKVNCHRWDPSSTWRQDHLWAHRSCHWILLMSTCISWNERNKSNQLPWKSSKKNSSGRVQESSWLRLPQNPWEAVVLASKNWVGLQFVGLWMLLVSFLPGTSDAITNHFSCSFVARLIICILSYDQSKFCSSWKLDLGQMYLPPKFTFPTLFCRICRFRKKNQSTPMGCAFLLDGRVVKPSSVS